MIISENILTKKTGLVNTKSFQNLDNFLVSTPLRGKDDILNEIEQIAQIISSNTLSPEAKFEYAKEQRKLILEYIKLIVCKKKNKKKA